MFTSESSLAFLILLTKQIQTRPLETEGVAELQAPASEAWETQEDEKREVSPARFHSTLLPRLVSSKYFRNTTKMQSNPEKRTTQWPLKITIYR